MKKFKRVVISFSLAICMIMCAVVADFGLPVDDNGDKTVGIVAYASPQVITGCFNGNSYSGKTRVYVSKGKSAKVKVCTFNQSGKRTSGNVYIRVTTPYDSKFHPELKISSTNQITLNYGYTVYDIQIMRRGTTAKNVGNCYYWSYDATSNCWFW